MKKIIVSLVSLILMLGLVGVVNAESFSIPIDGSTDALAVTVVEDGDWMVWTFDFPVEQFTGEGNLNVGLIIATDGEGNGPAFQIHNTDSNEQTFIDGTSVPAGTWVMSPWGTIDDNEGWFGWHGDINTLVTELDWVQAIGQRNTPWEGIVSGDGVMEIRIKKSELGESFHWAASPTVGTGFWYAKDVTMQIPTGFDWAIPLVDMNVPNYILVLPTPPPSEVVGWKRIEGIIPSDSSNVGGILGNSTPWSAKGGKARVFLSATDKHAAGDVEVDVKGLVRAIHSGGYNIGTAIDADTGQGMAIDVVLVCDLDGDNGGPTQVLVATGHLSLQGDFKYKGNIDLSWCPECTGDTDHAFLVVRTNNNPSDHRWIAYGGRTRGQTIRSGTPTGRLRALLED